MNLFEQHISEFLAEHKEVSLEKIGVIKTLGSDAETQSVPVNFRFDKKAATSPELIDFISSRAGKSKMLIASDLEFHLKQAREFINIGKTYEIINAGFIKKNNSGEYEFLPLSQAVKAQKNFNQPVTKKHTRKKGASAVQFFTLIIVLAIIGGLGYEAYQFFLKPVPKTTTENETINNTDTTKKNDTALNKDSTAALNTINTNADTTHKIYNDSDIVPVHYIFETTDLLLRAQSRTAKLRSYGSNAGYDSIKNGAGKLYSLYIIKNTKISDTLAVKDSLAKFLQKDIQIKIVPTNK
ncbi:MAG TPA: hypothetical protein VGI61_02495 [Parafilimonas sp.]